MSGDPPSVKIATAPFLLEDRSTGRIMLEVNLSLIPLIVAASWFFGISALLILLASTAGACVTEWLLLSDRKGWGTLKDGTALITGLLLGLTLPPSFPLWMAFLGGVVSIGLGKLIWGGMGSNIFNPALVGRAFLQAAFPVAITTWTEPGRDFFSLQPSTLSWPLMQAPADVISSASPLGLAKFEDETTGLSELLLGNTCGSLGETSAILLILCGGWLVYRGIFDWRLLVATLLSVLVLSALLQAVSPGSYPGGPVFMLLSGGLLFAAVYMVTDPVTTPLTTRGAWLFGIGVGVLVVLIRVFGGLPEGVMYAILLMNAVTPIINRYTQPRRFGG